PMGVGVVGLLPQHAVEGREGQLMLAELRQDAAEAGPRLQVVGIDFDRGVVALPCRGQNAGSVEKFRQREHHLSRRPLGLEHGPHRLRCLAELLYRAGDLTAARERYYATIEIDPDHLRARTSLGCVLAELGEHELALAALEGVLRQEPDYADAHWHTASVLADVGRTAEARHHLRTFLELAPDSPWAVSARDRLR
ncbi:MAG: tetratricopeptide repeat protein, partial [Planctomycetia bacterium]